MKNFGTPKFLQNQVFFLMSSRNFLGVGLFLVNCLHPIVHCIQPAHLLLLTLCFIAFFTLSLTSKSKGISKYTSYGVLGLCL